MTEKNRFAEGRQKRQQQQSDSLAEPAISHTLLGV